MTRYKPKDPELTRRRFINAAVGTTATVGIVSLLSTLGGAHPVFRLTPDKMPPMEGDILVGFETLKPITIADLSAEQTKVWPMGKDADGNDVVRSGEPNNLLVVYKYDSGVLSGDAELDHTIDGQVVAYSDVCTHAGCYVPDGKDGNGIMFCPCHSGQYAPKEGAKVVGGPPPHKLAQLPIAADGDNIKVTGFFLSFPYPYTNQADWDAFTATVKELT